MAQAEAPIRAGLIYQQQALADRLRGTLVEAGISIDAQYNVEALRSADLSGQDIEVYIVNLEPELEDLFDEVADRLDEATVPVVFNDAGVSNDLSGWDQARWARHLASKIRKGRGNLPPVPENAEAIPTPSKPEAETLQPAPVEAEAAAEPVDASIAESQPEAVDSPEPALADFSPAQDEEVAAPALDDAAAEDSLGAADLADLELTLDEAAGGAVTTDTVAEPAGAFDFDSIDEEQMESLDLLADDEEPPAESVGGDRQAYAAELAVGMSTDGDSAADADPLDADLLDADWLQDETVDHPATEDADLDWQIDGLEESTEAPSAPAEPAGPASDDAQMLAELLDSAAEASDDQELESLDLGVDDLTVADESMDSDFNLEAESGLDELEVPDSEAVAGTDAEEGLIAELESFSETELEGSAEPAAADFADGDGDFGALDLDFEVPDEPQSDDGLVDLDAMLASQTADPAPAPGAAEEADLSSASAEADPQPVAESDAAQAGNDLEELAELPDLDNWALEPMDGEEAAPAPAAAAPDSSKTPTKRVDPVPEPSGSLADLQLSLDDLGLVPMDEAEQASEQSTQSDDQEPVRFGIDLDALDAKSSPSAEPAAPPPAAPEAPAPAPAPAAAAAAAASAPAPASAPSPTDGVGPRKIVVLGASIGGPDSIRNFLSRLNTGLGAAFILVQHMGAEFLDLMAQQLDRVSPLGVHLARHGQELKEGEVVIAPVGQRLRVDDAGKLDLSGESGPTAYSPSIDQVLGDSLQRWGADRLLVIIFSGMASDAVAGSKELAAAGVPIWAQDPASCVISSMVDGVVAAKVVSFVGSPEQLAEQANKLLA